LFLPILALCTTRATDTDLYWHLASGDLIRRTGEIPRSEPFSFTVIGHRWIDIHWLFQVVLSLAYEIGGVHALDVLRAVVILGVFAFLVRRCRRAAGPSTVVAVLLLVTMACQERFLMRPEIVSWAFMLAVLAALERALDADSRPARLRILLLFLPLLQIVWVNVQGLFILGPAFIALALAAALVEFARARNAARRGASGLPVAWSDPDRIVDLLLALAISAVACLVNPYGAAALRVPFAQFFNHLGGQSLLSRTIAEFQPPLSGYMVTPAIVAFVALACLILLALLADFGRARAFELLVTVATLVLALRARRNIPIFALAAAPVLARHGKALLNPIADWMARAAARAGIAINRARGAAAIAGPALLAAVALWTTFDVATNRFFLRRPTERWFGSGEIPDYFPEESARFVAAGGIPGNVFHSLWAGGYLIHAWRGERGVFIDGRNDPYLDDVLPAYLKAIADPSAFEEAVRRYQITTVVWPHHRAIEGRRLLSYLARGRGWVLVHLDPAAAVYMRADVLAPPRLAEGPFPPGRDRRETYEILAHGLDRRTFDGPPIREIALGEFFSVSGDAVGAEFFFRRALDRLPRSAPVLYGYAVALERQGRMKEACLAYAQAVAVESSHLPSRAALGACLLEQGRMEEANRDLDAAYEGGERSARLLDARARLLEQKGDMAGAVAAYREALRFSPRDTGVLRSLALFYVRHDEPSSALPFYTSASGIDPDDPVVAREMAALLDRLGRTSAAIDVTRDASRRAMERLESGGAGGWTTGGPAREEDRRLLVMAADLETRAGDRAKASLYLEALAKSKGAAPD
jgi:tetratricopeptide (TPR) repeat protein